MTFRLQVVVPTPGHSRLNSALLYESEQPLAPGALVRVPLGKRQLLGVVWDEDPQAQSPDAKWVIRSISDPLQGLEPLNLAWRRLVRFTAAYYQRSIGEVALAALPPQLRELDTVQLARRLRRPPVAAPAPSATTAPDLSAEQQEVLHAMQANPGPFLLFGATGSGKTEVYLQAVQTLLQQDPQAQALVMVPEINLTPQLEARFRERFAPVAGLDAVVAMHSGLTPAQRLKNWLAAHQGQARIVLGTRMAVLASMPRLRLILVDEEHDPSYKSQDGARYSARDLAVYRAQLESDLAALHNPAQTAHCKVLLGSATPSLESWYNSRSTEGKGRYQRLHMPSRIGQGLLPKVRLLDISALPAQTVIAPALLDAIGQRIARAEQSLIFLNRRGYAPALSCKSCDWKSECPHCSAYRVYHKVDRTLRCHHCGLTEPVPRACPVCGDMDIALVGRGTERLEEELFQLLAGLQRSDGGPVHVARLDADSTRTKGALQTALAQVHAGEVDVLVGTQMLAKGHDFRKVTLVAAINPDGALFSADFRATERMFSLLMQAAGRAGRAAQHSHSSEMWIQTAHPRHPLYGALVKHDFAAFAEQALKERQQGGMPPYCFQALVRAEARSQDAAQDFLRRANQLGLELPGAEHVSLYAPVPMTVQKVANVERAQMLVECASRRSLQNFLAQWQGQLHALRLQPQFKSVLRWAVDVDPLAI